MVTTATTPRVVVIGENPETVDGLQAYFVGVGISAHAARSLDSSTSISERTTAVVVFPDELEGNDVVERISSLAGRRPRLLLLIITGHPKRFVAASKLDENGSSWLVLPKPAFGWTIVDAIRLHAETNLAAPR